MSEEPDYPWYRVVRGSDLEQGDLLRGCPRFVIPPHAMGDDAELIVTRETVDAIVLTQSCDLAVRPDGECEATDVLLCPYYLMGTIRGRGSFVEKTPPPPYCCPG